MKVITLEEKDFEQYAQNHRYRNYYQSASYAHTMIKFGYKAHYIGIIDETDTLIGATLLLYKEVFMNSKMAYAPRGILFDYTNSFVVKEFASKLKSLLGKQGFMYLKMDPLIPVAIRDREGNIINLNNETNLILANLKNAGFQHKGNNLYFENEKSRFEALVLLNRSMRDLFDSFDKRTRHKIRKAEKSGIKIYKDSELNIEPLYHFVKKKHTRPLAYYKELCKNFQGNIDLYYAVLDTEQFVISSKELYEEELDNNDRLAKLIQDPTKKGISQRNTLNKKMESDKLINIYKKDMVLATRLLKENPEGFIVGGALSINYDNASYLVIEGFNKKYKALNPNYLLKWQMMKDYQQRGYKYFNLNAVSGAFEEENDYEGLNEMKLGYGAVITEYIGEFDIVLNGLTYNLYRSFNKEKDSKQSKKQEKRQKN